MICKFGILTHQADGSSHVEVFLEIGVPENCAKSLKNTWREVHLLVKLQTLDLQLYQKWTSLQILFKDIAKV